MLTIRGHKLLRAFADRPIAPLIGLFAAAITLSASAAIAIPDGSDAVPTISPSSIDYTVLNDPKLDSFSLKRAHMYGLSDDEIANAYALARESPYTLADVIDRIEEGATIVGLAAEWRVPYPDVSSPERWRDYIRDYATAHRFTGFGAIRRQTWNDWPDWVSVSIAPVQPLSWPSSITPTDTIINGSESTTTTKTTTTTTPTVPDLGVGSSDSTTSPSSTDSGSSSASGTTDNSVTPQSDTSAGPTSTPMIPQSTPSTSTDNSDNAASPSSTDSGSTSTPGTTDNSTTPQSGSISTPMIPQSTPSTSTGTSDNAASPSSTGSGSTSTPGTTDNSTTPQTGASAGSTGTSTTPSTPSTSTGSSTAPAATTQ